MTKTNMKNNARLILLFVLFLVASSVYAGANNPPVAVTVKQKPGGQIVKQVTTDARGNFNLGILSPGPYTLEFRAQDPDRVRTKEFWLAMDGTRASGQQSFAGDSLVGGVVLDVEVGPAAKVTGQVAAGSSVLRRKSMVWMPPMLGSHLPGRWVEKGSAEEIASRTRGVIRLESIQRIQDKGVGMGPGR
jgi:hypothetical protein